MNMSAKTSEIVRCCYFHIHHIGRISKFLPRQTKERVVNALVLSRLEYRNVLLYGTVDKNVARLQSSKYCRYYDHACAKIRLC